MLGRRVGAAAAASKRCMLAALDLQTYIHTRISRSKDHTCLRQGETVSSGWVMWSNSSLVILLLLLILRASYSKLCSDDASAKCGSHQTNP